MPTRLIHLHHHKVLLISLGHMLQKETHHLRVGRGKDEQGHFAFRRRHRGIHIGILTNKLLWSVGPDARGSPGSCGDAQAAKTALIFGHLQQRSLIGGLSRAQGCLDLLLEVFFEMQPVLPGWPWDDAHAEPASASHVGARGDRWCRYALPAAPPLQRPGESAQPWQSRPVRLARKKARDRPDLARSSDIHDGARPWLTARWLSVPSDCISR